MLSFKTENEFRTAFPNAKVYQKANDPKFPCLAIWLEAPVFVKKNWGPGGSVIDVEANPETHILLVNCATGEVYPCAMDDMDKPVGYALSKSQPAVDLVAYDSEPVWATEPLDTPVDISTMEGVHQVPAGARLAFSESKNLYHIMPDKWVKMGFVLVA